MAAKTSALSTRLLTEADLPAVQALDRPLFHTLWSEAFWQQELHNNLATYVALEQEGRLAGYAGFWLVAGEAQVTRVAVAQNLQGQGLGTRLTAALIEAAWQAGATAVTLEVRISNLAAQKAYLRNGFVSAGIRPHYYDDNGEDAMIMWLYRQEEG
jgi:ribosomal-protein-alanine N-acetyltransferase